MKQALKNEMDIVGLINKIQEQITALDRKVDTLINRSVPEVKPSVKPLVTNSAPLQVKSNDQHKGRIMYKAICADCKKECEIPFKPSTDRPVYCKDCFSRRKVIRLSGITSPQAPVVKEIEIPAPPFKAKKKAVIAKKPVVKKKTALKKKGKK